VRQLTLTEGREVRWEEVREPVLKDDDDAIVRPLLVATCDMDQPMLRGEYPFPGPIALGHEFVAEVVETGPECLLEVGDRVLAPFQISCGRCERCRAGLTAQCVSVPERSMFGFGPFGGNWGGALSDLLRVPFANHMLLPAPAEVELEALPSAGDNLTDAYRTVAAPLEELPAAEVLVVAGRARSIGLYAVDIALALGAESVTYLDHDAERLRVAEELGAAVVESETPPRRHESFPVTVDASGTREGLACALRSVAPGGHCTTTGLIIEEETPIPLFEMYAASPHFHSGRCQVRTLLPEVVALLESGRLRASLVNSDVAAWDDAAEAIQQPARKLIITRA
jgi:threonine dehydrogenase-like Zn-dependent dehydrogenase